MHAALLASMTPAFSSTAELNRAYEEFVEKNAVAANASWALEHEPLFTAAKALGIFIPEDKYQTRPSGLIQRTLTSEGEMWLRREIRTVRFTIVKDWVALLSPVISILGLIAALFKMR